MYLMPFHPVWGHQWKRDFQSDSSETCGQLFWGKWRKLIEMPLKKCFRNFYS